MWCGRAEYHLALEGRTGGATQGQQLGHFYGNTKDLLVIQSATQQAAEAKLLVTQAPNSLGRIYALRKHPFQLRRVMQESDTSEPRAQALGTQPSTIHASWARVQKQRLWETIL